MRTIDQLLTEIKDVTEFLPEEHQYTALEIFNEAYLEHKELYGSFKSSTGNAYATLMNLRQDYQIFKVKEYVTGLKE